MPSYPTAPTEAATPGVTAPIKARTAPAIVVPAVISSAEEELSLFDLTGNGCRREAVDRQGVGLANRAHQGKGKRGCGGVDPMSHEGVSVLLCPMSGFNAEPCCLIQSNFRRFGSKVSKLGTRTDGPSEAKSIDPPFEESMVRAFGRHQKSRMLTPAFC
jgi:hypothetical protein